jgi:hypothetical protein
LRIGGEVFRQRRRIRTTRRKKAEGKCKTPHAAAATVMQGANYDDVAKVGAADRGNFRPDDRANKDKAQFGSSFPFQAARQKFGRRRNRARCGTPRRLTPAPFSKPARTATSRARGPIHSPRARLSRSQ